MIYKKLLYLIFLALVITNTSCHHRYQINSQKSTYYTLDSTQESNGAFAEIIEPYKSQLDSQMNKTIGMSKTDIDDIPLSNLVSDIVEDFTNHYIDSLQLPKFPIISIINIKGLRAPIPEGEIKTKDIFALMPFENNIVILEANYEQLNAALNHVAEVGGDGIAGATFTIEDKKATNVFIHQKKAEQESHYYIATSDYLANGGDYYTCLQNPIQRIETEIKLRDAIINYIENQNKTLTAHQELRIKLN